MSLYPFGFIYQVLSHQHVPEIIPPRCGHLYILTVLLLSQSCFCCTVVCL